MACSDTLTERRYILRAFDVMNRQWVTREVSWEEARDCLMNRPDIQVIDAEGHEAYLAYQRAQQQMGVGVDWPLPNPEAAKRAGELLRSLLPQAARQELELFGTISVKSLLHERLYQISAITQTWIFERNQAVARACLQLTIAAPVYDRMIAEYLLLRNDERLYLRTANLTPPGWAEERMRGNAGRGASDQATAGLGVLPDVPRVLNGKRTV